MQPAVFQCSRDLGIQFLLVALAESDGQRRDLALQLIDDGNGNMLGRIYCGRCLGFQPSAGCKHGAAGSSVVEAQLLAHRGQVSGMGGERGDGLLLGGVLGQAECGKHRFQQWIHERFLVGWIDGQLESGCSALA